MIPGKEWNFIRVPTLEEELRTCFIFVRKFQPGSQRYDYYLNLARDLQEEYKERTGDYYRIVEEVEDGK